MYSNRKEEKSLDDDDVEVLREAEWQGADDIICSLFGGDVQEYEPPVEEEKETETESD